MKLIVLAYLLLALCSGGVRRAPAVLWARSWHAVRLCCLLGRRWRVAWHLACRRHP